MNDSSPMLPASQAALDRALASWPTLALTRLEFEQYLAQHGYSEGGPHLADLALAAACVSGCNVACRLLSDLLVTEVKPTVGRVSANQGFVDEVLQVVRDKLLVGALPKIASYSGRGPLQGWLRIVARRCAVDLLRQRATAPRSERRLDGLVAATTTPESAITQARYAPIFKQVLSEVLAELSAEERNLLKLQVVDNLPVPNIADFAGLHVATVYRRLSRCHAKILTATRERLREQLGPLSHVEVQSLFVTVKAEIGLSLTRLLDSQGA